MLRFELWSKLTGIMLGGHLLDTNSKFILSYSNQCSSSYQWARLSQAVPISVFSVLLNLTSIMFTEQSFSNYVLGFKQLGRNSYIQQFSMPTASSTVAEPSTKTDHNWMCKTLVTGCFEKSPKTLVFSLMVTTSDSCLQICPVDQNSKGLPFSPLLHLLPPGSCQDL